ncbi:MAG TPA: L,D-transpeptidase [Anaerolineaceae bacterium]|nr:L,D-transpeptidase [Anaerolineaceae bacterium]
MRKISRREFLRIGFTGLGATVWATRPVSTSAYLPDFPLDTRLGRTFYTVEIKSKPDPDSSTVRTVYDDTILSLQREIIGKPSTAYWKNRKWYETPEGYIPSISVQPVKNKQNFPMDILPDYGEKPGTWAEVTVPYVDIYLDGTEPKSPRLQETVNPRFYYSQVLWIDGIQQVSENEILYHVIEKHGSYGDAFWADARAFKPITPEDISPISPDVKNKYISIDLNHQTISCFENEREILFARVSTGAKYNSEGKPVDKWSTPPGDYHSVNRKYVSLHMAGGETKASGYEEFAVSWTSIFASGGVAIHSTYWHNNYGEMLSHGCVNVEPEVAKFVFRWTLPETPYYDGKIEVQGFDNGTNVKVKEFKTE